MHSNDLRGSTSFYDRALAHCGKIFFVESMIPTEPLVFLGRMTSLIRMFNIKGGERVSVDYIIEARAGVWDKERVNEVMRSREERLRLISDWKEAEETTTMILKDLVSSSTMIARVPLSEDPSKLETVLIDSDLFLLEGRLAGFDYKWTFLGG